jgi:hypothetical protein
VYWYDAWVSTAYPRISLHNNETDVYETESTDPTYCDWYTGNSKLALIREGDTIKLYLNGVLKYSAVNEATTAIRHVTIEILKHDSYSVSPRLGIHAISLEKAVPIVIPEFDTAEFGILLLGTLLIIVAVSTRKKERWRLRIKRV